MTCGKHGAVISGRVVVVVSKVSEVSEVMLVRLLQCARGFRDSGKRVHLFNILKYTLSISIAAISYTQATEAMHRLSQLPHTGHAPHYSDHARHARVAGAISSLSPVLALLGTCLDRQGRSLAWKIISAISTLCELHRARITYPLPPPLHPYPLDPLLTPSCINSGRLMVVGRGDRLGQRPILGTPHR
jgi:hypothetical protein